MTVGVGCDVMKVVAISVTGNRPGSPRFSFMVPVSSLAVRIDATSVRQCWQSLQKCYFHRAWWVFASLCLWLVPGGLWWWGRDRRYHSVWANLFWMISFPVILRPFQSPVTFLEIDLKIQSWGSEQMWHLLPALALQMYDFELIG